MISLKYLQNSQENIQSLFFNKLGRLEADNFTELLRKTALNLIYSRIIDVLDFIFISSSISSKKLYHLSK